METAWREGLIDAGSTYLPTIAPLQDGDTGRPIHTYTCWEIEERTNVRRAFSCHVGVYIGEGDGYTQFK